MDKPKTLRGADPAILACYPPDTVDPWRGTGRTTRQIQALPDRSLFVVFERDYTLDLARRLGRVVGPSGITLVPHWDFSNFVERSRGREWAAVELDHAVLDLATKLEARQIRIALDGIQPYIRPPRTA
jgi:hypothetical protein